MQAVLHRGSRFLEALGVRDMFKKKRKGKEKASPRKTALVKHLLSTEDSVSLVEEGARRSVNKT